MKLRNTFSSKLRANLKRVLATALFGGVLLGGMFNATATGPAFNGPNDYPTLQVARANASGWSTSTPATIGETVNLLVWIDNYVNNTTAHNTTAKVILPTAASNDQHVQATVSASNAATVTGNSVINVGQASHVGYINGTAKLFQNDANNHLSQVNWPSNINPDTIATTGVNLGDQAGGVSHARAIMLQVMVEGTNAHINTNEAIQLNGGAPFNTTASATPGDVVSFMVYFDNDGNMTGTHPQITNALDDRLTYVPNSSYMVVKRNNQDYRVAYNDSQIAHNGNTLVWSFDNMAPRPDASFYLIFQAKVADASHFNVGATNIVNHAVASFDGVQQNTNDVTLTINRVADQVVTFNLQKQVKNVTLGDNLWYDDRLASAAAGDVVAYRLNVINTGTATAQNVVLKDLLPSNETFVGNAKIYNAANPNGIPVSGDAIVNGGYTFASIAPGNANGQSFYFEAKLTGTCTNDVVTNLGQVIYSGQLKAQDGADLIFSCTKGLIISKTALDLKDNQYKHDIGAVTPSQTISYRINVINNGATTVVNPVLRDMLPSDVTYIPNTLSIDDEVLDARSQQDFFKTGIILTTLTPGMSKTIKVQFKAAACAAQTVEVDNTAFVKGENTAEISDTAKAKILACGTPTPTPTPPTTPPTTPGTPTTPVIPKTGPGLDAIAALGVSGFGATVSRYYLLKKKLKSALSKPHII